MVPACWIVRHGQSTANAGAATRDPASIPLSPLGQRQAEQLARWFSQKPALVVTSPYVRTGQTAAPLLERFSGVRCEQWPIHEFTYLSPGRFLDTSQRERASAASDYWAREDPHRIDGPGAESLAQLFERVAAFEGRLGASGAGAVVFCHGQFMQAFLYRRRSGAPLTPAAMRDFRAFCQANPVPNTGMIALPEGDKGAGILHLQAPHLTPDEWTLKLHGLRLRVQ